MKIIPSVAGLPDEGRPVAELAVTGGASNDPTTQIATIRWVIIIEER